MERNELAEKLELVGGMFEIDGMNELLKKFNPEEEEDENGKKKKKPLNNVRFNAVVIQIASLLMRENQEVADKIICMSKGLTREEVDKLGDAEYAVALRTAIITDVMGFFGSSPSSGDKK